MAGAKAYDQCLEEHDFEYEWPAWMHETGNAYGYSCVSDPLAWGDSETMREQGKACVAVWAMQINLYRMSETGAFRVAHSDMSHPDEPIGLP